MFFYYDPTYILVIIGAVICMGSFGACQQYLSKICTGAEPVRYDREGCSRANPACKRDL